MDKSTDNEKKRRRQAVVDELKSIGVKGGVLRTYREEGRRFPRPPTAPNSDWSPTVDHYPCSRPMSRRTGMTHGLCPPPTR